MANDLTIFEEQLKPLAPHFAEALAGIMPVDRLIRTLLISCARNPELLRCQRQTLINAGWSAAVLGLEVDGVTGQAFIIPFKQRAQLVIGYKGYNTLGARADITIDGHVVREGDALEYELGSRGFIRHKPLLEGSGRIMAAWATATHASRPPVIVVLSADELAAIKARSPAAQRSDSPWNDPPIGFPAMCAKSAKRRLARALPLTTLTLAAGLDEAFEERGRAAWIDQRRTLQIEGEAPRLPAEPSPTPTAADVLSPPHGREREAVPDHDDTGAASLADRARAAAAKGQAEFQKFWNKLTNAQRDEIRPLGKELRTAIEAAKPR